MSNRRPLSENARRSRAQQASVIVATCAVVIATMLTPLGLIDLGAVWAQDEQPQLVAPVVSLETKLDQKGTIILRDASLVEWLFAIQREWGIDIVSGNELQKDIVSGAFTDATLREVLTSILVARGYGYRQVGKSLLITRLDEMTIKPDQRTILLPLEFVNPQEVASSVQLLLSKNGQLQPLPSSKSLFIIDSPEVIERVQRFLAELEANASRNIQRDQRIEQERQALQPLPSISNVEAVTAPATGPTIVEVEMQIEVFRPQYIAADVLAQAIQNLVDGSMVSIVPEENKVIVSATPAGIAAAGMLLRRVDIPRKQVRITAHMYDVNVEVMEKLGFNWSKLGKGRINGSGDPQSVFGFDSRTFSSTPPVAPATTVATGAAAAAGTAASGPAAPAVGSLVTLSNLSRHFDFHSVIEALERTDGARLLARPNIMAYDRTEASFESVQEIPVQELTQTSQGGNIGTTQFREAGIILRVTPNIMDDDSILLQVTPEFSVLNGFNNGQPIIDRRSATSRLKLNNGETAVIGGLVRRNEIESASGIPGLMNLKWIGVLFRHHETTISESELVVFIQAEVVQASYPGNMRDLMAHATVNELLDQMPLASPAPVTECCRDPYCPYHNPRPRVINELPAGAVYVPGNEYDNPNRQMAPRSTGEGTRENVHPLPEPSTPVAPPAAFNAPARNYHPPVGDSPRRGDLPPPVVIDEMARRYQTQRATISRLPATTKETPIVARQSPMVVHPYRQARAPSNMRTLPPATSPPAGPVWR